MAQTISIQRGSTTVTNGSTVTLFTNGSSGLGTRIIINQLAYSGTNTASGNRSSGGSLIINGSGVGATPIGMVGTGNSPATYVAPFLSSNVSTAITFNTSGSFSTGVTGVTAMGITGSGTVGISTGVQSMMPQTFWIGPSDVIQTRPFGFLTSSGKGGTNSTVTIYYSFTLITES
jgi:hypothetical protein